MYRQALALSVALCGLTPIARPQGISSAWTADQFVQAALNKNRDYLSAQQRIREAQGIVKQAGVGIPDSLDISTSAGQAFGNSGEDSLAATYSHTFETFGKRNQRIAVAEKELAMAQAEVDERRRTLVFEVKTRYADAVAAQLKFQLIDGLSKVNQDYLRLTQARAEKGDAAPLEVNLLQVELNRDQVRLAVAEGRARSTVAELRTAIDALPNEPFVVARSLPTPRVAQELEALRTIALQNRPDLRLLQLGVQQSQAQLALAKVETKPNVTLSGQYAHNDAAFDQYGFTSTGSLAAIRDHVDSIGIGVSIPLTSARRNRGNIEAAAARQASAQLKQDYLRNVIASQVEAAYRSLQSSQKAAAVFDQGIVTQSEKNLDVMRQAYNLGELRLLDVLNEQRRLLDTELSYIDTQVELFRAYAELEQAVGGVL